MSDLPKGFYAGDVYCLVLGMPGEETVELIPGEPAIALGLNGVPKVSLLDSTDGATLMLEATWAVNPEAGPAIADAIARARPDIAAAEPQTTELDDVTAQLDVVGEDGASYTVGPKESSGVGSYVVAFHETLAAAEKHGALAAMRGGSGALKLTYKARLALREEAEVRLEGDLAADLHALVPKPTQPEPEETGGWFSFGKKKREPPPPPPPPSLEACASRVDLAIGEGRLRLTARATPNASAALTDRLAAKVKELAARQLLEKATSGNTDAVTALEANFRRLDSEMLVYDIERVADLGPWLGAHDAARLVLQAPSAIPSPNR